MKKQRSVKSLISLLCVLAMAVPAPIAAVTGPMIVSAEPRASAEAKSVTENVDEMTDGKKYKTDEILVTYDDSVSNSEIRSDAAEEGDSVKAISAQTDGTKIAVVATDDVKAALTDAADSDSAISYQPNYIYTIKDTAQDPYAVHQPGKCWYLDAVQAYGAWDAMTADGYSGGVKVCVIDTGCQIDHDDLKINRALSRKFKNGRPYTLTGDSGQHGTHVSGIINMTYGNGIGGAGIAAGYNNDIVDLFVCGVSEDGFNMDTANIVAALNYGAQNGAKIINMSFGSYDTDAAMTNAISSGYSKYDIVYTAANGNDGLDIMNSPANMSCVISAGSININRRHSYFSNYNRFVDVAAPGDEILSTVPADKYYSDGGTSMSCACVSAIAALIRAASPSLKNWQVANIIKATAVDIGASGRDDYYGSGAVNALNAVRSAYVAPISVIKTALYGSNDVIVSWSRPAGASRYLLQYRKYGDPFRTAAKLSSSVSSYKFPDLVPGQRYQFRMFAYAADGSRSVNTDSSFIWTLRSTTVTSVRKYSSQFVRVGWRNIQGESGYQISSTRIKSQFLPVKTVNGSAVSAQYVKTVPRLAFYYRVRAFTNVNGRKIYGPWSAPVRFVLR